MLLIANKMKVRRCDVTVIYIQNMKSYSSFLTCTDLMIFVNLQLSLTESEMSKIGTIKVEAIINPTNAELDLKDGVGEKDQSIFLFIFPTNHFPTFR